MGWLTFNLLQRLQFSLDCAFLLSNSWRTSRNQFRISCSKYSTSLRGFITSFCYTSFLHGIVYLPIKLSSPIPIYIVSISGVTLVLLWNQGFTPLVGRSVVRLYYLPSVRLQNGISAAAAAVKKSQSWKDFPLLDHRHNCIVVLRTLIIVFQKWNFLKLSSKEKMQKACHFFSQFCHSLEF